MPAQYRFIDEWDVAAPIAAVFAALADGRTYPRWWTPVYQSVEGEAAPAPGATLRYRFKGRLPYTLRLTARIEQYDPPHSFTVRADGDLSGEGVWTLTPTAGGVHVRFDWRVNLDRPMLRLLSPVLRPAFRWNHSWAIKRAIAGLEPYARAHAAPIGAPEFTTESLDDRSTNSPARGRPAR